MYKQSQPPGITQQAKMSILSCVALMPVSVLLVSAVVTGLAGGFWVAMGNI
jgi:hypothetical protein